MPSHGYERYLKVLDHGYVHYVEHMGTDQTIIEAARMSTGKGFVAWEGYDRCEGCGNSILGLNDPVTCDPACNGRKITRHERGDAGLLEFLYKNQHHTPFEMCELALEFQWPIMVGREAMRHRVFSFNEFSARYAQMPNLHYVPELSRFKKQSTTNKQGSSDEAFDRAELMHFEFGDEQQSIYTRYQDSINNGLSKEVARLNTPVSRYSKVRMKGDLRGWLGFLNLRKRPNAQYEMRCFADAAGVIVKELWPRAYALFEEYDLKGVRLSATEAAFVRKMMTNPDAFDRDAFVALCKKLEAA